MKDLDNLDLSKTIRKANPAADSLAKGAADSAMTGAANGSKRLIDTASLHLSRLLDKMDPEVKKLIAAICTISDTTNIKINKIGTSVHWQIGRLTGDVKDMKGVLLSLTNELKKQTQGILGKMVLNALDSLKSKKGKGKIDSVMSALLDSNTKAKMKEAVGGALQPALDSISATSYRIAHKDAPYLNKQLIILFSVIGGIILVIIAFVWYERNRYAKTLKILTYQIDKMPAEHQAAYDDLTHRIQDEAQKQSLEPFLSKVLKGQGINS